MQGCQQIKKKGLISFLKIKVKNNFLDHFDDIVGVDKSRASISQNSTFQFKFLSCDETKIDQTKIDQTKSSCFNPVVKCNEICPYKP